MGGEAGPSGGPLNAIKQTLLGAEHSGELVPDDVHDALQLQGLHALSLGRIVDIEPTFSAMAQRRLRRQLGGRRKTPMPNLFRAMWIIAYMSIGVGFVGLQGGFADLELRVSIFKSTPTFVYFVLILAVVWIAMRTYAVVRWCLAWLLCGTGLALIIGDQPTPTGLTPWLSEWLPFATLFADFGQDFFQLVIASVTISLVLLTILIFFGVYHIYPRLISCLGRCRGVSKLWSITRVNRHSQRTAADGVVTERLEFTYAPRPTPQVLPAVHSPWSSSPTFRPTRKRRRFAVLLCPLSWRQRAPAHLMDQGREVTARSAHDAHRAAPRGRGDGDDGGVPGGQRVIRHRVYGRAQRP
jgi:hypothetical protein